MLQKHFTDCFWAYDTKDTTIGIRTINSKYRTNLVIQFQLYILLIYHI